MLDRSTHGWVEFVEHLPCRDHDEARRYYERAGMLLCLFYVLEGTDCHYENIIERRVPRADRHGDVDAPPRPRGSPEDENAQTEAFEQLPLRTAHRAAARWSVDRRTALPQAGWAKRRSRSCRFARSGGYG